MMKMLVAVLALVVSVASNACAAGIADLFTAVDLSTMATSVTTILVALIGISLLFVGMRYIRKSGVR